ncbi:DUF4387 domain-containing protein [Sulfitobacter sp. JB4-11]|uniref:DUF4387 domain-containing protein n=1 Tax=Sulfitobacter rhodophyticola TaxID=3238304 RepID=UPI003D8184F1
MVLGDLAKVVRSKNAGPTMLTIDVIFGDEAAFVRGHAALTPDAIAMRYGRPADDFDVIAVPAARAVKIVFARAITAGGPGDRDGFGAQQHAPMLGLEV